MLNKFWIIILIICVTLIAATYGGYKRMNSFKNDIDLTDTESPIPNKTSYPKSGLELDTRSRVTTPTIAPQEIEEEAGSSATAIPDTGCFITASATAGPAPLSVKLTYNVNYTDTNINVTGIQWDFDGNNTWDTKFSYANGEVTHNFTHGEWQVRMRVQFSDQSMTNPCSIKVNAY